MIRQRAMKVGELARQSGVSIRALHYYDEIGLLTPSCHTGSGHRLYHCEDVARLQQIKSLQQLGFSLEEIKACLTNPDFSPIEVMRLHLARLKEQMEAIGKLSAQLERLVGQLDRAEAVSVDDFLWTIWEMTMFEKYYTPEQLEELKQRKAEVGEERIQEVEEAWPKLIAAVREEMEKGTDPYDPKVQELARQWMGFVQEFSGGNKEIEQSSREMYRQEPSVAAKHGLDAELFAYVEKALSCDKGA